MLYTLTVFEVDAIVSFKASFGLPVEKVGRALAECDMGCPFSKLVVSSPIDLRGYPIVCYNGELCTSVLRIPRAAFTHFPVLRKFLAHVITALSAHRSVCDIDNALTNDNHRSLIKITGVKGATTQAAHAEAISFKIGPWFNNHIGLAENLFQLHHVSV